jgi:formylglycine-generating enzyme required for sulfatase activity
MRAPARSCRGVTCVLLGLIWLTLTAAAPSKPATAPAGDARVPGKAYIERLGGTGAEIEMVWVPAGHFRMGSPAGEPGRSAGEWPQHDVRLDGFWISKHEMTWGVFRHWYPKTSDEKATPNRPEGGFYKHQDPAERPVDDRHPVTAVTQFGAQAFCRWLSEKTGYPYRLPTEAEWEYTCRAGSTTAYDFGDDAGALEQHGWFGGEHGEGARRVGLKKPNAFGLHDMHGNVAEWTLDGWTSDFRTILKGVRTNPWVRREAGSAYGVVRGGDWTSVARNVRSAARRKQDDTGSRAIEPFFQWYDTTAEGQRVGFRIVSPVTLERDGRHQSIEANEAEARVPLRIKLPQPVFISWQPLKEPGIDWPRHPDEARLMVPAGTENVARGMPVRSDPSVRPTAGTLDVVTDGEKCGGEYCLLGLPRGLRWVQIDLRDSTAIHAVMVWHGMMHDRAYLDVVVQVSDDPWFKERVTMIFNNDTDGSAGLGKGKDREYADTMWGRLTDAKGVRARYVRLYADGSRLRGGRIEEETVWSEVEVYGTPTAAGRVFREEQRKQSIAPPDEKR